MPDGEQAHQGKKKERGPRCISVKTCAVEGYWPTLEMMCGAKAPINSEPDAQTPLPTASAPGAGASVRAAAHGAPGVALGGAEAREARGAADARAAAAALLPAHPLHGLFHEALQLFEAVLRVRAVLLLRPLRRRRGGAAEAADHVCGGDVDAGRLRRLHGARHAHVALAELARCIQPERPDEALPTRLAHGAHRQDAHRSPLQPGQPHHVSKDLSVGAS
mmetsp:Transcript_120952/g.338650  ORF Transcript_120952/g.338650 Transcript_120952/m.338650 type:complete len:220 (+) Transcript_120952:320-979(+)